MFTNRAPATLWRWTGVARDGPLIAAGIYGVRVPLGAQLCTMTNAVASSRRARENSELQADLPKVHLRLVVLEGITDFLQWKPAIDDGFQSIDRYRPDHVLLICPTTNGYPADTNLIRE